MHDVSMGDLGLDARPVETSKSVLFDGLVGAPIFGAVITMAITFVFALTGDDWTVSNVLTWGIVAGLFLGLSFGFVALVAAYVASALRPKVNLRDAQNRDLIWVSAVLFGANFLLFSGRILWEVLQDVDSPEFLVNLMFVAAVSFGPSLAAVVWMKFIRRFSYLDG